MVLNALLLNECEVVKTALQNTISCILCGMNIVFGMLCEWRLSPEIIYAFVLVQSQEITVQLRQHTALLRDHEQYLEDARTSQEQMTGMVHIPALPIVQIREEEQEQLVKTGQNWLKLELYLFGLVCYVE